MYTILKSKRDIQDFLYGACVPLNAKITVWDPNRRVWRDSGILVDYDKETLSMKIIDNSLRKEELPHDR
jgi:hypothetical protein